MLYTKNQELKQMRASDNDLVVMVESESDLEGLEFYGAGVIAYTAGFKQMWQLGADGEWVAIVEA